MMNIFLVIENNLLKIFEKIFFIIVAIFFMIRHVDTRNDSIFMIKNYHILAKIFLAFTVVLFKALHIDTIINLRI